MQLYLENSYYFKGKQNLSTGRICILVNICVITDAYLCLSLIYKLIDELIFVFVCLFFVVFLFVCLFFVFF